MVQFSVPCPPPLRTNKISIEKLYHNAGKPTYTRYYSNFLPKIVTYTRYYSKLSTKNTKKIPSENGARQLCLTYHRLSSLFSSFYHRFKDILALFQTDISQFFLSPSFGIKNDPPSLSHWKNCDFGTENCTILKNHTSLIFFENWILKAKPFSIASLS